MRVKVLKTFVKEGRLYREGEEINIHESEVEYYLRRGLVDRFVGPLPSKPPNGDSVVGSAEIDPPLEGAVETTLPPLLVKPKKK